MDKSLYLLETEIEQLKKRLEKMPEQVLQEAKLFLTRAKQIHYPEGAIQCLIVMSRCAQQLERFGLGIRYAKEALTTQNSLDNDRFLPLILHLHAINYWEDGKIYTAQQYWIQALEQATLEEEIEILIESLIGLGNIWRNTNDYQLAYETHELAVTVANNTRLNWLEGRARIFLAWDLYLLENYGEMLIALDVALELLEDHGNAQWLAEIWDFRALALLGLERLEDAEEATRHAHDLAVANNMMWVKAHSYLNRARLEHLRHNISQSEMLIYKAEKSAQKSNSIALLAQVYEQQAIIAEQKQEFRAAFSAFQKYRTHSLLQLKEQMTRESKERIQSSKKQLEQRAKKLINRIRSQYEYDPETHFSNFVSETHWWEQLVTYKMALTNAQHSVIVIQHAVPEYIDVCTEITHSLCSKQDLVARISADRLGVIIEDQDDIAKEVFQVLKQMIQIYPWKRKGLKEKFPVISFHDILGFPFTLEQLTQMPIQESPDARSTQ